MTIGLEGGASHSPIVPKAYKVSNPSRLLPSQFSQLWQRHATGEILVLEEASNNDLGTAPRIENGSPTCTLRPRNQAYSWGHQTVFRSISEHKQPYFGTMSRIHNVRLMVVVACQKADQM